MPKKRLPKGQKQLVSPEVAAMKEFQTEMGMPLLSEEVICPFCAHKAHAVEFRTRKSPKSKSYSTRMFECPDCHQRMRRDTLLKDMTVSEWARFLYLDVIMYGGYNRISFPKIMQRLKEYGWASEFWEAWRAVKEGRSESDIEDYLDYKRSYEEEHGWISAEDKAKEMRSKCDIWQRGVAGIRSMFCTPCEHYDICWGFLLETNERD